MGRFIPPIPVTLAFGAMAIITGWLAKHYPEPILGSLEPAGIFIGACALVSCFAWIYVETFRLGSRSNRTVIPARTGEPVRSATPMSRTQRVRFMLGTVMVWGVVVTSLNAMIAYVLGVDVAWNFRTELLFTEDAAHILFFVWAAFVLVMVAAAAVVRSRLSNVTSG